MHTKLDFNFKTILITGGAGFIGSNIAFYFQENYPLSNIVIFDCFRGGEPLTNGNLKSFGHYKNLINFKGTIICGDINNKDDLERLNVFKIDYIFHQAAISDTRVYDQELVMRTNVNSFYDIISIGLKNNATIVYASSASTYGSTSSPQTIGNESPENPYGYSKFAMDNIALDYKKTDPNLRIIGLRYFNAYGPREFYKGKTASLVIQLGHQILDKKIPQLFQGSDKIFRDFIYIDDIIQAVIKSCSLQKNGIYNVGTGQARSFQDISDILQKELNTDLGNSYFPNPHDGYQFHTQADISSTISDLGYSPNISLEQGIKKYISEIKRLHGQSPI